MTATAYRFHSIEADGPWASPPFPAADRRHIIQGVVAGFIMGRPRWAEDLEGNFIYGLDAKGKETKAAPAYTPKAVPKRRGPGKPKTYQVEQQTQSGDWKVTDWGVTKEYADKTAQWVKSHGGTARVTPDKTQTQRRKESLDAALATTLETRRADPYDIASWDTEPKGPTRHSTKKSTKKSPAELDRDIAEALAKDHRVTVRVEGAPKPVHVSGWMTRRQAEHAAKNHKAMVRDRGWTHVVEIEDKSGAVTRLPR